MSTESLGTENVSKMDVDEQVIARGTHTDTLDVSDNGCQTKDSTFQDVGCQIEDVKSTANQIKLNHWQIKLIMECRKHSYHLTKMT